MCMYGCNSFVTLVFFGVHVNLACLQTSVTSDFLFIFLVINYLFFLQLYFRKLSFDG